ncbi:MAG: argininosuccinate lyase [Nitrososphaerota archaeon]|jgi:argininosuccinate lyase|nr:argininosuccinate lyase [Nitrososphaerota archaeon]MDG6941485.1 argininosuccinate lyase [Nitrososphaerota archaeon]MDG6951026.1 argininosuccinate lyase [Nitrososphaerota archaeon]
MDIRGPRLRKPSDEALAFTSSMADDGRIARKVILVNLAHMVALVRAGEVDRKVGARCAKFLAGASAEILPGAKAEDFHQQLEQAAVDALGVETAGFINYGKSRNDQVATAIRMELRDSIIALVSSVAGLQSALLSQARKHGAVLVPGYTHLQRAQPTTFAHHLFAHFDAFQRDAERALQLYTRVNLSPMGSAAMTGTSVKLDRRYVAGLLGFSGLVRNSMDAVSSRDFAVEALSFAAIAALDASRLAEELILWSSAEFGFIELDDSYAASSSIMPQKKNAVTAEMARAKAGSVIGGLVAACAILKALPYSYNLDLQEITPHLWRGIDDATASLSVLAGMVASASLMKGRLNSAVSGDGSTAVGLANYLVSERGISFRQAHAMVGELVRASAESGSPLQEVAVSRLARVSADLGKKVSVDRVTIESLLDPQRFLERIATKGGANPRSMLREIRQREAVITSTRSSLSTLKAELTASERRLRATTDGLTREVKSVD